ncbi:MAG: hypothetical protein JWM44_1544 [Bacilli bacterium]|nr:hypothetical protein [Bacilli bacterium]
MNTQYWREQRLEMEKMASDTLQALDAYGKQYDSAYKTDKPNKNPYVPHGWDAFSTKKIKYSPEQQDAQEELDDNREAILDLIGKRIQENGGIYDGHTFPELLYPSHLDEDEAKLIHDYPRLLDAMKEDSRRDRGGILFHFANSLHLHKDNPEKQKALYDMLSHDLDHHKFWGWKDTIDPDDYEPYGEKSAAYWRGQREVMEKMATKSLHRGVGRRELTDYFSKGIEKEMSPQETAKLHTAELEADVDYHKQQVGTGTTESHNAFLSHKLEIAKNKLARHLKRTETQLKPSHIAKQQKTHDKVNAFLTSFRINK